MDDMRILFAASEVYPFAKSGGLADVAHSLPRALHTKCHIDVILPLYGWIDHTKYNIEPQGDPFELKMGRINYSISLYICEYEGIRYRFVHAPLLSDREYLYGNVQGGYADNDIRFGLFNYAMLAILKREQYDIVHLNDWQCALLPLLLQDVPTLRTKTLFTIHNLAFQGVFEKSALTTLGIDKSYFTMDGIEFYGKINLMKAGIAYADGLTTVSETYAKEILTPEFGCGLEGFLAYHQEKLTGIVNGIDVEHFNPSSDTLLYKPYHDLVGKAVNKRAYLKQTPLTNPQRPLMIFIGRFTWQKGMDLFIDALEEIASLECNIAILGEGEEKYHTSLKALSERYDNIYLHFGYDEALSHRMYAASDLFLMPSLFEPCGLAQMIAMAYGALPIVHSVGGLADTVHHYAQFDAKSPKGYGILFNQPKTLPLLDAVKEALTLYKTKKRYNKIIKHNMASDFSWKSSAELYIKQYEKILKR